jgi:hypothetical protein
MGAAGESLQQFEFYVAVVFGACTPDKTTGVAKNDHLICPTGKSDHAADASSRESIAADASIVTMTSQPACRR